MLQAPPVSPPSPMVAAPASAESLITSDMSSCTRATMRDCDGREMVGGLGSGAITVAPVSIFTGSGGTGGVGLGVSIRLTSMAAGSGGRGGTA